MIKGGKILAFFITGMLCMDTLSQQLSHQVLVPLAGITSDKNLSYTQTVGETAVEIVGCSDYVFTQGFQQPGIKISTETPPPGTGVKVYPNPATDYVTIELFGEEARTFRIEFLDITGTVVINAKRAFDEQYWNKEQLDIVNLIRGFYLVRITSEDKLINRTFKVEKI
jgi:hypothetical protein